MASDDDGDTFSLEPCPFCGGRAVPGTDERSVYLYPEPLYEIRCTACPAVMRSFDLREIVSKWNSRK
jgi:hypothetical protein